MNGEFENIGTGVCLDWETTMLGKILGSGQLGKLASFVSPAFFDVMPARAMLRRAKTLLADSRDEAKLRHIVTERAAALSPDMPELQLRLSSSGVSATKPQNAEIATWQGSLVVELYFRQLFLDGPALLDLRAASFRIGDKTLVWSPTAWIADFAPEFIGPLREIYLGFYRHDDAVFRHGLAQLNLSHSEDLFRQQFGEGQDHVLFQVRAFIDVFHRVFERCRQHKTSLHPDFLPLGIYLAALYDHEQELGVAVDVSGAFAKAQNTQSTINASEAGTAHSVARPEPQEPNHA